MFSTGFQTSGGVTVIALVRDAAMMIGIYALADRRADDAFLAAVLTVIGYSVMDTIVILDRIRENTKVMAGSPYDVIVNESIKQTMTRSFNTLATVVITLVALLALGGAQPEEFRLRAAGRHRLGRLPLDLLFGSAGARFPQAAARGGGQAPPRGAAPTAPLTTRSRSESTALQSRGGVRVKISLPRVASGARRRNRRARLYRRLRRATGRSERARTARSRWKNSRWDETETIDPLDAQNAGLHDEAIQQGHEEINLNLDEFEQPPAERAGGEEETKP